MKAVITSLMALGLAFPVCAEIFDVDYGTFEAPDGYTLKQTGTMDSFKGTLTRTSDGFTIDFDVGHGTRVTPFRKEQKAFIHTHSINGNFAYTSLERANGKVTIATTICDWCERGRRLRDEETIAQRMLPRAQREAKLRELNESMIQLNKERPYPANFWANVTREEDVLEFMLIVGSYRPTGLAGGERRESPSVVEPPTGNGDPAIHFGAPMDGNRIGLWSESNRYGLHHMANIWIVFEEKGKPVLPPIRDGVLIVTHPDNSISKESISWPVDGPAGGRWRGGIGGQLYPAIQKPGAYKVQWVIGDLESSVVTFTVTPELEQPVTDPGLMELEMLRKARGAAEQFIRADAASQRYDPVFLGGSDHGVETWLVYRREMKNGDVMISNYSIVACNKTTGAVRWIPVE